MHQTHYDVLPRFDAFFRQSVDTENDITDRVDDFLCDAFQDRGRYWSRIRATETNDMFLEIAETADMLAQLRAETEQA